MPELFVCKRHIGQTDISDLMEPSFKERKAANRIRFIDFEGLGPCCPDRWIRALLSFLLKRRKMLDQKLPETLTSMILEAHTTNDETAAYGKALAGVRILRR